MVRFSLLAHLPVAFLALFCVGGSLAKSTTGNSVLVLLNEVGEEKQFSEFFGDLEARGFKLTYETPLAEASNVELIRYGEKRFDHLVFFADQVKKFPEHLSAKTMIQYVNHGGNILLTTGPQISETVRNFAMQFGIFYEERDTLVIDHFQYDHKLDRNGRHTTLALTRPLGTSTASLVPSLARWFDFDTSTPVLYEGIGHVTSDNPMTSTVLSASDTAYSAETQDAQVVDEEPVAAGQEIGLVSIFEGRNNARVSFTGSRQFFSDVYFKSPVKYGLPGQVQSSKSSGNKALATQLAKWTLQEIGVLRVTKVLHNKVDADTTQKTSASAYRIKDYVSYRIDISEYYNDKWQAFKADDIQLEAIMLDPYVRTNLTAAPTTSAKRTATTFETEFQLPDVFGVYTLMVRYQRPGYSWIEQRDVVPVRPYHHDEYPRFLSIAYPYYTGAASVMLGFLVFCAVWLYTPQGRATVKSSSTTTTTTTTATSSSTMATEGKSKSSTRKSK